MADMSVAQRRTTETQRLLSAADRLAQHFGVNVKAPKAKEDVEMQRLDLIAYAADVLEGIAAAQAREPAQATKAKD